MLGLYLSLALAVSQPVVLTPAEDPPASPTTEQTPPAAEPLYEDVTLESTDAIVTEEDYAASYVNYMAPPETVDATPVFSISETRLASDTELALTLARIENAIDQCVNFREIIESRIGERPGSYSVNTEWVTAYQNCILQRKADLDLFKVVLERRYASIVVGSEEESVTRLTDLVDRLNIRHSHLSLKLRQEIRLQKKFVAYYNTGKKSY